MPSSYTSTIEILDKTIVYLYQYIGPMFFLFGNIGNLFSALVFAKKSWRKNVCVLYFNACLISNTCYINSTTLGSILTFGFHTYPINSNVFLCKIYYYVAFVFSLLLPIILILASIDRLLISSQNVDTRLYSSKRLAYFSLSVSTSAWLIFCSHILIKVNILQFSSSNFLCYYDLSKSYSQFVFYSVFILTCFLCFTMIILCSLAFKNVRHIHTNSRQQQRQQIRTMTKKDFQLLRCLYVHDIVYISFGIEISFFYIYQAVTANQILTPSQQAINDFVSNLCIFIGHIPRSASFYIFLTVSKAFRNEFKRMFYKMYFKKRPTISEEDNEQGNVAAIVVNTIVS